MRSTVDLHTHSSASDGSDVPLELIAKVQAAGIHTFALTDHDTIDGVLAIKDQIPPSLRFIKGIEFSTITPYRQAHIVGLYYDEQDPVFLKAIEEGKTLRRKKLDARLAYLKERFNITFGEADLAYLYGLSVCAKPHLARVLMKNGYGHTITEAIDTYLRGAPEENSRLEAEKAIAAIHHAHGLAIWAHPLGGENVPHMRGERFDHQLNYLMARGLDGLEVYYSRFNDEEVAFLKETADAHHLLISGGSDYHGKNKNIALGTLNDFGMAVTADKLTVLKHI